ncbi:carbonate dehydratase [Comamonadaceae bacterium OH3737_COT-264]|nr:carbonate dehydratase [Comamonadaceae bacterium OH3737_COT-264]
MPRQHRPRSQGAQPVRFATSATLAPTAPSRAVFHAPTTTTNHMTERSSLQHLLDANHAWAEQVAREKPGFFEKLSHQQSPKYLWIGCSDSRVPANQVVALAPGEVFVHRNVANVVVHSDLNALSVIQYAVDYLKVEHIMVVGHYGCGGVLAALHGARVGLADNWLRHVHDVKMRHRGRLMHLCSQAQEDVLCEMNVIEQVGNIAQTNIVLDAWKRGQPLAVHGWCYGLKDGKVKDLGVTMSNPDEVLDVYRTAIKRYPRSPDASAQMEQLGEEG